MKNLFLVLMMALLTFSSHAQTTEKVLFNKTESWLKSRLNNPSSYKYESHTIKKTYLVDVMNDSLKQLQSELSNYDKRIIQLDNELNNLTRGKYKIITIDQLDSLIQNTINLHNVEMDRLILLNSNLNDSILFYTQSITDLKKVLRKKTIIKNVKVVLVGTTMVGGGIVCLAYLYGPLLMTATSTQLILLSTGGYTLSGVGLVSFVDFGWDNCKMRNLKELIRINENKIPNFEREIKSLNKTYDYINGYDYSLDLKIASLTKKLESDTLKIIRDYRYNLDKIKNDSIKIKNTIFDLEIEKFDIENRIEDLKSRITKTPKNKVYKYDMTIWFYNQCKYGGVVKEYFNQEFDGDLKQFALPLFDNSNGSFYTNY
jgi:hypothetical protein